MLLPIQTSFLLSRYIVDYVSLGQYSIKSFNERRQCKDQSENKSVRMPGSEELKKNAREGSRGDWKRTASKIGCDVIWTTPLMIAKRRV